MSDNDLTDVDTTPPPTPNSMPGAQPPADVEEPPAAEATPDAEPVDEAKWRALVKQWKSRAQENWDKAKQFDEIQDAKKTAEERLITERDEARQMAQSERLERLRERVARETGVPPEQIHGSDEDAMRESATAALDWAKKLADSLKRSTPATPPASNVTGDGRPPKADQIRSRDELKRMSARDILQAEKDGRLDYLKGMSS